MKLSFQLWWIVEAPRSRDSTKAFVYASPQINEILQKHFNINCVCWRIHLYKFATTLGTSSLFPMHTWLSWRDFTRATTALTERSSPKGTTQSQHKTGKTSLPNRWAHHEKSAEITRKRQTWGVSVQLQQYDSLRISFHSPPYKIEMQAQFIHIQR